MTTHQVTNVIASSSATASHLMQLTINRVMRLVVCKPIVYYRLGDACGQRDRTLRLGGGCSQLMPRVVMPQS
jgi:hypothetical protein